MLEDVFSNWIAVIRRPIVAGDWLENSYFQIIGRFILANNQILLLTVSSTCLVSVWGLPLSFLRLSALQQYRSLKQNEATDQLRRYVEHRVLHSVVVLCVDIRRIMLPFTTPDLYCTYNNWSV